MLKKRGLLLLCLIMIVALVGCSGGKGSGSGGGGKSLKLPDAFPTDFPLPDNIKITQIKDESEGKKYNFGIRFTFDPDIDMDATFKMYNDYANRMEYNVIIGGEEYFSKGTFQFGATSKFSASNMFVVTLKPEGPMFGDIQLKYTKE